MFCGKFETSPSSSSQLLYYVPIDVSTASLCFKHISDFFKKLYFKFTFLKRKKVIYKIINYYGIIKICRYILFKLNTSRYFSCKYSISVLEKFEYLLNNSLIDFLLSIIISVESNIDIALENLKSNHCYTFSDKRNQIRVITNLFFIFSRSSPSCNLWPSHLQKIITNQRLLKSSIKLWPKRTIAVLLISVSIRRILCYLPTKYIKKIFFASEVFRKLSSTHADGDDK